MSAVPLKVLSETSRKDALANAHALIGRDLAGVNALIIEKMESQVPLIPELARHLIAAGGKRIRPVLTLLAARMCGYGGERHVSLAACVEFIHTATLLHDDVVDESDLRRGRSTANSLWGNKAPVLVGDFLFSRAFELMVADGSLRVLKILSNASAVIAEGEVAQLVTANDMETDEDAYFAVIRAKTAALFKAASQIGAVVAERSDIDEQRLANFGEQLGVAFQLVDDALDYSAHQAMLGKTIGDDFADGKVTLPVIIAFREGDAEERAFWRRTMEAQDYSAGDLKQAQAFLARHRAIERTLDRAVDAGRRARHCLDGFEDSLEKQAMLDLVDFAVERAF